MLLCCLKVSNVSFDFPEIEISSMVKQTSLHANCFSGVSLTLRLFEIDVNIEITS